MIGKSMTHRKTPGTISIVARLLTLATLLGAIAFAQTKLQGTIKGRSGSEVILQTANSPDAIVLLTDSTDVGQIQGVFKARNKKMSMAALIPGLPIQVEGAYDEKRQLVAKTIRFKGNDLERAYAIEAGLSETKETLEKTTQQAQENKEELEKQNAALAEQNAALKEQQEALTEQEKKIAANKAAIAANSARFGQLHDYYIIDEVAVYFGNAKVEVEPKYNPQLVALAEKAKTVKGYMMEVKGYASASGSAALNQKLSQERASNVTNILLQLGHIPLTNMLAPGAMGETEGAAKEDKTQDTEAANRRVVVRILQNKAIAGT
jgi:outer membrane protein OmpA-like peptidoglycan-associated protein